jgi:hypothetical protein
VSLVVITENLIRMHEGDFGGSVRAQMITRMLWHVSQWPFFFFTHLDLGVVSECGSHVYCEIVDRH